MGADGGVVCVPVRDPKKIERVLKLLRPFWQFLGTDGLSTAGDNGFYGWCRKNPRIRSPEILVGVYGTDRGNFLDLESLRQICNTDLGELSDISFSDLDLEVKTRPTWMKFEETIFHHLMREHFGWKSHEETKVNLDEIGEMKLSDWVTEISEILDFNGMWKEETWTLT